jgi:hypothetical protein
MKTKHCKGCDKDLPFTTEYFGIKRKNKDGTIGYKARCKSCLHDKQMYYLHRKKAKKMGVTLEWYKENYMRIFKEAVGNWRRKYDTKNLTPKERRRVNSIFDKGYSNVEEYESKKDDLNREKNIKNRKYNYPKDVYPLPLNTRTKKYIEVITKSHAANELGISVKDLTPELLILKKKQLCLVRKVRQQKQQQL